MNQSSRTDASEDFFKEYYRGFKSVTTEGKTILLSSSHYDACTLAAAAEQGNREIMQLLIDDGYDINAVVDIPEDNLYIRPLSSAILASQTEMVSFLIDNGASVYNDRFITPNRLDSELLSTILERGAASPVRLIASLMAFDAVRKNKLFDAKKSSGSEKGQFTSFLDDILSRSPLAAACAMGDIEVVRLLLDAGAEFGEYFHIALYAAVSCDAEKVPRSSHSDSELIRLILESRDVVGFDRLSSPTDDFEQYINGEWRRSCEDAKSDLAEELQIRAFEKCYELLCSPRYESRLAYAQRLYTKYKSMTLDELCSGLKRMLQAADQHDDIHELMDFFATEAGFYGKAALPFRVEVAQDAAGCNALVFATVPLSPEQRDLVKSGRLQDLFFDLPLDFDAFVEDSGKMSLCSYEEYRERFSSLLHGRRTSMKDIEAILLGFPVADIIEGRVPESTLVVADVESLRKMGSHWNEMSPERQKNYLQCALVAEYAPAISCLLARAISNEDDPAVSVYFFLKLADPVAINELASAFTSQAIDADLCKDIDSIAKEIKDVYKAAIENAVHFEGASKVEALRKLDSLTIEIAGAVNEEGGERRYALRDFDGLNFIEVLQLNARSRFVEDLNSLGKPGRKNDLLAPWVYNAAYIPLTNNVVLTPAFLQPPNYAEKRRSVMNYAALGSMIGHEISHAFDPSCGSIVFDEKGDSRGLFSGDPIYSANIEKLVHQFDEAVPVALRCAGITSAHVDGMLTVAENFADLAGLEVALLAYAHSRGFSSVDDLVEQDPESVRIFFQSYALRWRAKNDPDAVLSSLGTDLHAPNDIRANTVRNLDSFHAVYGTRPGDGMWLDESERVHVLLD